MHRNQKLYDFLLSHSTQLTEEWFNSIEDQNPNSVYSSTNEETIKKLKAQNQDYFLHVYRVFIEPDRYLHTDFKQWSEDLAKDPQHLETPLQNVVREYMNSQEIMLKYVKKFIELHKEEIDHNQIMLWNEIIIKAVGISICEFIESYHKNTSLKLQSQKNMIAELSSPIILLQNNSALLPLVGDIDTNRAKIIIDKTLKECSEKGIFKLFIDLSGVAIIDTMVAHQIFNLVKSLKLIGVKSIISGIRPEIAQTAVQLGLTFEDIHTTSSLDQALQTIE